jgi:hypothetical protein
MEKIHFISYNHGKHGKVAPVPPFFSVFRAFSDLFLFWITGNSTINCNFKPHLQLLFFRCVDIFCLDYKCVILIYLGIFPR